MGGFMTSLDGFDKYSQLSNAHNWEGLITEIEKLVKEGNRDLALKVSDQFFKIDNNKSDKSIDLRDLRDRAYKIIFLCADTERDAKKTHDLAKKAIYDYNAYNIINNVIQPKIDELIEKGLKEKDKKLLEEALKIQKSYESGCRFNFEEERCGKIGRAFIKLEFENNGIKWEDNSLPITQLKEIAKNDPKKAENILNNIESFLSRRDLQFRSYIHEQYAYRYAAEENLTEVLKYDKAISEYDAHHGQIGDYDFFLWNVGNIFAKKGRLDWAEMFRNKIGLYYLKNKAFNAPPAPPAPFPKKLDVPENKESAAKDFAKAEPTPSSVTPNTVGPNLLHFFRNLFK